MRNVLTMFAVLAIGTVYSHTAFSEPADSAASDAAAHKAHEAYVAAINSNNLEALLEMLTEDVVFMAAHAKPFVGKAAVGPWLDGYLKAYKAHWDKPVQEFVVNGEWAFERYSYNLQIHPSLVVIPLRTQVGDLWSTTVTLMASGA
jgi:hypothetical protein